MKSFYFIFKIINFIILSLQIYIYIYGVNLFYENNGNTSKKLNTQKERKRTIHLKAAK